MKTAFGSTVWTLLLAHFSLLGATHYVSQKSTNPSPPYTTWATAATNIQGAVDVCAAGEEVVVTNGVYVGGLTVTRPIRLLSVNGPRFTVINGDGVPCATLNDGASITGFTLTNGIASGDNGGGVSCASTNCFLTNCVIVNNVASPTLILGTTRWGGWGGGVYGGTLYQCTLSGNQAITRSIWHSIMHEYIEVYGSGGGAYGSVLRGCTVSGNSASSGGGVCASTLYTCRVDENFDGDVTGQGGGAYTSTLYDCTLSHNTNTWGGGALGGTLSNCVLVANYANLGGGAAYSGLVNCTLTANSAGPKGGFDSGQGGGATYATLYNCTLTGNSVDQDGGGAYACALYNCTLTGNSAYDGGGAWGGTLDNCIVYFNIATNGADFVDGTRLNYCCTAHLPTNGIGNIVADPLFVDANGWINLRLQPQSPCINAGNNSYVTNNADLDGRPRIIGDTVDMGAYEFQPDVPSAFIGWLQKYSLSTAGLADHADSDRDGMDNWQEWICGTCPTNPASALRLLCAIPQGTNVTVTWQSVAGVNYFLEFGGTLDAPFQILATNIVGKTGTTSYIYADTNSVRMGPVFHRIGVHHSGN